MLGKSVASPLLSASPCPSAVSTFVFTFHSQIDTNCTPKNGSNPFPVFVVQSHNHFTIL